MKNITGFLLSEDEIARIKHNVKDIQEMFFSSAIQEIFKLTEKTRAYETELLLNVLQSRDLFDFFLEVQDSILDLEKNTNE